MNTLPQLGDENCPWFDPNWPFMGMLDRKWLDLTSIVNPEIVDLSLEKACPVAGFAGWRGPNWKSDGDVIPQQLLCTIGNQWLLLLGRVDQDWFDPGVILNRWFDYESIINLGTEGKIGSCSHNWASEKTYKFKGDLTLMRVAEWLVDRGFVQSHHWPILIRNKPQLKSMVGFLIDCKYLCADGGHPSHLESKLFPPPIVAVDGAPLPPGDGVYEDEKAIVWGGVRYDQLTKKMVDVLKVLVDQYGKGIPIVPLKMIQRQSKQYFNGSFKQQAFKQKRKGEPSIHPVANIIESEGSGFYRLIDPKQTKIEKYP